MLWDPYRVLLFSYILIVMKMNTREKTPPKTKLARKCVDILFSFHFFFFTHEKFAQRVYPHPGFRGDYHHWYSRNRSNRRYTSAQQVIRLHSSGTTFSLWSAVEQVFETMLSIQQWGPSTQKLLVEDICNLFQKWSQTGQADKETLFYYIYAGADDETTLVAGQEYEISANFENTGNAESKEVNALLMVETMLLGGKLGRTWTMLIILVQIRLPLLEQTPVATRIKMLERLMFGVICWLFNLILKYISSSQENSCLGGVFYRCNLFENILQNAYIPVCFFVLKALTAVAPPQAHL